MEKNHPEGVGLAASCMAACPVHTPTQAYVQAIAEGRYEDAMDLLLSANPFSSVCGRICHHPCEQNCRRIAVDKPISLRGLKRFVMDQTKDFRKTRKRQGAPANGKKAAIIGAGPSGLTAAQDLAMKGYQVTVFEASDSPGGMLGKAIPRYRLPFDVVMEDIADILALGVELKTNTAIGKDLSFADLRQQGFNAILLAIGLAQSKSLGIPGIDSKGILLGIPFLRMAAEGVPVKLGEKVVVIGGGNVAIDVARTARRLGSKKVTMVSLESRKEMPAWEWEIQEAVDEGIELMPSWGPKAIQAGKGGVRGIELKKCTRVFDENKRFNPAFDESVTTQVACDNILIAIGQGSDFSFLQGSGVKLTPRGLLEWDGETFATSVPGIFASGETVTGPGSAVEAVASGHRAAEAMDHWLQTGTFKKVPKEELPNIGELPKEVAEKARKLERVEVGLTDAGKRVQDFEEFERTYTEAEALREARRCVACATGAVVTEELCAACLTCVRVCPFGVATVDRTASTPAEKCLTCGLCAAECPAAAIALSRFGTEKVKQELARLAGVKKDKDKPIIVSFNCIYEAQSRRYLVPGEEVLGKDGVLRIMVPCVARLKVTELLMPFELGADGVAVIACEEGECVYPTAEDRLEVRVRRAKQLLDEIGIGGGRMDLFKTKGSAEESWEELWEESRNKIKSAGTGAGAEVSR